MCTSRELVAQNLAVLRRMAKYTGITSSSTADDGEDAAWRRGGKIDSQVCVRGGGINKPGRL